MLVLVPVLLYVLFLRNFSLNLCSLFSFTLHPQDGFNHPWRTVTEDCTTNSLFIILDAFFEGPSMFTILDYPIWGRHNIQMSNYVLYHRAGHSSTKTKVDLFYRRSSKFDILGRFMFNQIADCQFITSCNVTHHCYLFSVLVVNTLNEPRQAEDISVHGVPYMRGEGYFVLLNTRKWSIVSSIVCNSYFMETQGRFHVVSFLFFDQLFFNTCWRNFLQSVLLFRITMLPQGAWLQ